MNSKVLAHEQFEELIEKNPGLIDKAMKYALSLIKPEENSFGQEMHEWMRSMPIAVMRGPVYDYMAQTLKYKHEIGSHAMLPMGSYHMEQSGEAVFSFIITIAKYQSRYKVILTLGRPSHPYETMFDIGVAFSEEVHLLFKQVW